MVAPSSDSLPVTVVVPTYERQGYLPELVDGLRNQAHADFRCVIVDDGSTDDTVERLSELIADDHRF